MSSFDPELLHRLADADAATPPPGGASFTPFDLVRAEARRTRRRLGALAAATLLTIGFALGWPRVASRHRDDEQMHEQLLALRVDVERLQATLRALTMPAPPRDPTDDTKARATIRYELAQARAATVVAAAPAPQEIK